MKDLRESTEAFFKEIAAIRQAPISFAIITILIVIITWTIFHFAYSSRIDSKDATIQARESERDKYKADAERSDKELSKLKSGEPERSIGAPTKKYVMVLADQLYDFAKDVEKNYGNKEVHENNARLYDVRFHNRLRRLRDALDESGIHSDILDHAIRIDSMWLEGADDSVAAKEIEKTSLELKKLAGQLRD